MCDLKVTTKKYDIAGNGICRMFGQYVRSKLIPIGNFGHAGAGWQCLLSCWIVQCVGKPFFWLSVRFDRQIHSFFMILERWKKRKDNV